MKTTISKRKNIRGNRIVGWTGEIRFTENDSIAWRGPECQSSQGAAVAAQKSACDALGRLNEGFIFTRVCGVRILVMPTAEGWAYYYSGMPYPHFTNYQERNRCIQSAAFHVAQTLWTVECDDDQHALEVPRGETRDDLVRWMRWQRAYAKARAEGVEDEQARRLADAS